MSLSPLRPFLGHVFRCILLSRLRQMVWPMYLYGCYYLELSAPKSTSCIRDAYRTIRTDTAPNPGLMRTQSCRPTCTRAQPVVYILGQMCKLSAVMVILVKETPENLLPTPVSYP